MEYPCTDHLNIKHRTTPNPRYQLLNMLSLILAYGNPHMMATNHKLKRPFLIQHLTAGLVKARQGFSME
jgi:hypothetical protein